jgi:hypothetical protein
MGENLKNKAEFIVVMINEFAKRHQLNGSQAFRYLDRYHGIDMLDKHYDIAHTLRFEDVLSDMTAYCQRWGGAIQ